MNSFKKGRQHVPVSLLPVIVQARDTTFNALIADAAAPTSKTTPKKRGPAANIQQQLERVSALPKAKQRTIAQVLDFMLAQADASGLCGEDYRIFWVSGTLACRYDEEHSEDEERWVTLGLAEDGTLLVVVHTLDELDERKTLVRIISARHATAHERQQYQSD